MRVFRRKRARPEVDVIKLQVRLSSNHKREAEIGLRTQIMSNRKSPVPWEVLHFWPRRPPAFYLRTLSVSGENG